MITIDAPISFLVGGAIALATKDPLKAQIQDRSAVLLRGLILQSVILTPMILFFMLRFPDWEWNYMFDARQFFFANATPILGIGLLVVITALINVSFLAGFRLVEAFIIRNQTGRAVQTLVGTLLLVGVIMAVMFEQTLHLGTYAEYNAGSAQLVITNVEFVGVLGVSGVLLAVSGYWVVGKSVVALVKSWKRSAQ